MRSLVIRAPLACRAQKAAPARQTLIGDANSIGMVVKQRQRAEREAQLSAKQCALPQRRYDVILADPEWRFQPYSRETGMDRVPTTIIRPRRSTQSRPVM